MSGKCLACPLGHTNPFCFTSATEIKDAKLIFNQAWKNIEDHYGRENIHLPREFIFLMGAPG
jgi:adenylate kinase